MAARAALLLALATAASAALRGPSFTEQASEISSMMESVRYQTEGGPKPETPAAPAKKQEDAPAVQQKDGELYPGQQQFDDQLLHRANLIEEDLKHMSPFKGVSKRPVIAMQQQESKLDRAKRYFATHGMAPIGHILSNDSAAEELKSKLAAHDAKKGDVKSQLALVTQRAENTEQEALRQQLKEKMAAFHEAHKVYEQKVGFSQKVEKRVNAELAKMNLSDDDDDLDGYKKSWAKVDAFRERHDEPANL